MIKLNLDVVNCYIDSDHAAGAQHHAPTTRFGGIGDSGCSTSCASYRALCSRFGKDTVDTALYKEGYNAVFKVADNQTTASLGQLRLTFGINDVQFTHVFYVLPELSHDFILGNNFLVQANAVIDYRQGSLTLTSEDGIDQTKVHFGVEEVSSLTSKSSSSPQRESVLFNSNTIDIEPGTSRYVQVTPMSTDDVCTTRPFGVVGPHFSRKAVQTPYGVMQLDCSSNHIWLSNFGDELVQVQKGTPVATFVELPRSTVDLYAANLNTMELYNLPSVPGCECSCCPLENGDSQIPEREVAQVNNTEAAPTFNRGQPPRDRFVPFEGKDDEHLSHHPRFTFEQIEAMSAKEISSLFTNTFLKDTNIGKQLTELQHQQMKILLLLNRDVFGKNACPGSANHEGVRIPTGDALPTGFPLRPTLPPLRPIIDEHIDIMLKHNIIEPSDSPWSAAVLLVPKKGGEWRFAVDYRRLNSLTVRDSYPLPRISDALASLSGNQYFSACDALAGFHNLPMAEDDKCKTAFRCHRGSFQFNRLPFGLVNAPAAFQRYMDVALSGINFNCALIYLDDILIFSKSWDEHMRDCNAVFDCVRKAGLHLKLKKCTFGADRVKYLGHVVGADGVRPCTDKTAVVDSFCLDELKLKPKTARPRIRSWLGLAGYYSKYIPRFARITKPIHDFLKSRKTFTGASPELREAVRLIKEALTSSPILAHPDFDLPFEVHCDASPSAIGATLTQKDELGERVVMYISRTLKPHERRYHQYEREALGLVWSLAAFRPYLLGRRFKAVTDNKALLALFKKEPGHRMIRWVLSLQQYDVEYLYRAGTKHGDADGCSRAFDVPSWASFEKGDDVESLYNVESISPALEHAPDATPYANRLKRSYNALVLANSETIASDTEPTAQADLTIDLPSLPELIAAQKEDKTIRFYTSKCSESVNGTFQAGKGTFFLKDGLLLRRTLPAMLFHKQSKRHSDMITQICVPRTMRRTILYSVHGLPVSGHDGVLRTQMRLRRHFHWDGMLKDCKKWVKSCLYCQRRKRPRPKRNGLTQSLGSTRPFEMVSFDIVGRLPETNDGNEYLLTVIDHFTRYPLAIPIPNRSLSTVVSALYTNLFTVFGPPRVLLSDCERSFVSKVTEGCFSLLGTRKINTSGYQSQANGSVERFHRYLNAALTITSNSRKNDWDSHVDSILFAYRTSVCLATGYTPFRLLFGREANAPPDLLYNVNPNQLSEEATRGVNVSESLRVAMRNTRRQQLKVHLANKARRDKTRRHVTFQPGDLVMYFDHTYDTQGASKLQWLYSGPHIIERKCAQSNNLYWIRRTDKGSKLSLSKVNVNRLCLADADCGPLGPPLGWGKELEPLRNQPTHLSKPPDTPTRISNAVVGDMVALRMEPDPNEPLPFAVGEIIRIERSKIVVRWFGQVRQTTGMMGIWKPGYVDNGDNKRYYHHRKLHKNHEPYTSGVSESELDLDDIICQPFQLTKNKKIPSSVLRTISNDPTVAWTLPSETINVLFTTSYLTTQQ